jgi:hypothetical protein
LDRIWRQLSIPAFPGRLSVLELIVSLSGKNVILEFGCYDNSEEAYSLGVEVGIKVALAVSHDFMNTDY